LKIKPRRHEDAKH